MGLYLGSLSDPPFFVSVFMPAPYCFDYYNFVIWFEIRICDTSSFVFPFQDSFGYSDSFVVPYKF